MQSLSGRNPSTHPLFRGLGMLVGLLAGAAAATITAVLAVVFAATVAVMALLAGAVVALGLTASRARRRTRTASSDPDIIEARNVGGHSWVAYGWDGRS